MYDLCVGCPYEHICEGSYCHCEEDDWWESYCHDCGDPEWWE